MVFFYRDKAGYEWTGLHKARVYFNGEWRQLKPTDKMYVNGEWVELGNTVDMVIYVYNSGMAGIDGPYYTDYVGNVGRPGKPNIQAQFYKNPSGAQLHPSIAVGDVLTWDIAFNGVVYYTMPKPAYAGGVSDPEFFCYSATRQYFDKQPYGTGNSKAYFI